MSKKQLLSIVRSTCVAAAVLAVATPALAQDDERELGSANSTELGLVLTAGNSNTANFNVRNLYAYNWENADLDWEFGILRASSGDDRFAVGNEDDFELIEPDTEPDNSRIFTNIRYTRNINSRFFWYARAFAERDEPADIDYRVTPSVGAGNTWIDNETHRFRTGYGVSYTAEELKLEGGSSFVGYQLFYELNSAVAGSTTVESNLTWDGSFEEAGDYRFDWLNGVGVSMTDTIALKASLRLVYRNQPALEEIDLQTEILAIPIGKVIVPKKKLDTAFTTSLVISF